MADPSVVHIRESRKGAREIKFVVNADLAQPMLDWMRANLEADAYGTGPFKDEYATSSLYFENDSFDVFNRRGSYGKAKYRIRRYALSPKMFLERKFRTDRLLSKRRTTVPVVEFERLEGSTPDRDWAGYWFHRRLLRRRLRPLVQVSYVRTARTFMSSHGPVRMTMDFDLRVLPLPDRAFLPGTGLPLLEGKHVVEVKYCVALPALFRQLVEQFTLQQQPMSKFRAGLGLLGLSPDATHA